MTHSQEEAFQLGVSKGIRTDGIGTSTASHLNVTRSLADPAPPSEALRRAHERAEQRSQWERFNPPKRGWYQPKPTYAGYDEGEVA